MKLELNSIKHLIEGKNTVSLKMMLSQAYPQDIAAIMEELPLEERKYIFHNIQQTRKRAVTLAFLHPETLNNLLFDMHMPQIRMLFKNLGSDDIVNILKNIDPQIKENIENHNIIKDLMGNDGEHLDVTGQLQYDPNIVAGIMNIFITKFNENLTVKEAIQIIRDEQEDEHTYRELEFYLYVVNDDSKLVGVVSITSLLLAAGDSRLNEICKKDPVTLQHTATREEAATLIDKYDLIAVPVVNEEYVLLGIVTFDDTIDTIRHSLGHTMLSNVGVSEEVAHNTDITVAKASMLRLPWLVVTMFGSLCGSYILNGFEFILNDFSKLVLLITVILGVSGNVGAQTGSMTIHAIATGTFRFQDIVKIVERELKVALTMGAAFAVLMSMFSQMLFDQARYGFVAGVALLVVVCMSAVLGIIIPYLFHQRKYNVPVASMPIIQMISDLFGIVAYFTVSSILLLIFKIFD